MYVPYILSPLIDDSSDKDAGAGLYMERFAPPLFPVLVFSLFTFHLIYIFWAPGIYVYIIAAAVYLWCITHATINTHMHAYISHTFKKFLLLPGWCESSTFFPGAPAL